MLKRRNKFLIILLICLMLSACDKKTGIRKEYESLNKEYRVVSLDKDNPFIESTDEEIEKLLTDKKTFIVFYASSKDNYSRSIISLVSDRAKYFGIHEIYYVNRKSDIPVLSGYIKGLLSGTSNCVSGYQVDPKMELTEEMINDSYTKIDSIIEPVSVELSSCDIEIGC